MAIVPVDGLTMMDRLLLKACTTGDINLFSQHIAGKGDDYLSSQVTPEQNNCLHLAAMLGHHGLARKIWLKTPTLFCEINKRGETPLIAAIMAAKKELATDMLTAAEEVLPDLEKGDNQFVKMLLSSTKEYKDTALHHAIRNGFDVLAIKLLDKEEELSRRVNFINESPMHMAARKGYSRVVEKLLKIDKSEHSGPQNSTALHAAVNAGHTGIIKQLLKERRMLARHKSNDGHTPLACAVYNNNIDIVKILLEHDPMTAYLANEHTGTPFLVAAVKGFLPIAKEIISICPDSAYILNEKHGANALHEALYEDQQEFVDFILRTPQLHRLVNEAQLGIKAATRKVKKTDDDRCGENFEGGECGENVEGGECGEIAEGGECGEIAEGGECGEIAEGGECGEIAEGGERGENVQDNQNAAANQNVQREIDGDLPLHNAARECKPNILRSLLSYKGLDYTAVNNSNQNAVDLAFEKRELFKTLKWKESFTLVSNKIPTLSKVRNKVDEESKKKEESEAKALSERYATNTSLVAALLATITFAAAFTLPGGFSSDSSSHPGQPVLAKNAAFQAFLIFDTIAMCSSLAAAFLCILTPWTDLDFLLNYRKITVPLMWCAYVATGVAFGTGLFTVMELKKKGLAIVILILCCLLPALTMAVGYLPKIKVISRRLLS
ncbi:Ankyrin repeat family protein [Rhynchospora pubera]|uniref:Ankyrin repeat family protein n=1 Tax=Rhynchospora pubera TaxID=906938 RepID=A0AAV8CKJ6_9POAL|nr:Ankyrin repeat family protein [Rhynchospora pubera]